MGMSSSDMAAMYTLLMNSMSGDAGVRKQAELALSGTDSRSGFCSCLLELITSPDLVSQADIRLMASVYLKNSINRYWRTSSRRSIPDTCGVGNDEKVHIRKKLLSHLREPDYKIAAILAVIISKIARIDYPREWPDLFPTLIQQLQSADVLLSHQILMVLFRVLKELSSKRLTSDQKIFAQISMHFFDYGWHLWQSDVQKILHGFSTLSGSYNPNELNHEELHLICERWLFCLKIIRQLVVSGFPSDAKSVQEVKPIKEVSPALLNVLQSFLPFYSSFQERNSKFWDFIKRACIKLMKVLIALQGRHPYSFSDKSVLPPVINFCLNKITDPEPYVLSFEQFLIQCMVMVKNILECKEYKPSLTGRVMDENGMTVEQVKKNISNAVDGVLNSLLPGDRVIHLCGVLIRRYFVLSATDLEEWYQNPESFHHEQDMVLWTEKLRPCAEALYIVLFENHSQILGPVVVSILREAMNGCSSSVTDISPGLLLKDAAYGAAAYVYYELSNYLSFKDWFNGALFLEISNDHPNMRIIRRKVALILGQWVSEVKDDTKRQVYCALIRLLQDKDLSVQLAACRSLCLHVEDANFSEEKFTDLLPVCWESCIKLVDEVQEFDSKVQVLNLISILIDRVSEVIPYSNVLISFFQKVWEESSGESLLQIQLLTALRNLVVALGYQSPVCYNMLMPILDRSIDVNHPDEINLLEDSLLLWEATVSHAPSLVPSLLSYFPRLVDIMERSFDHLEVAINIIETYILLGGNEFISMLASSIARILDLIIGNVNDRGLLSTFPTIDLLVQCFPAVVPPMIGSTLQKLIVICLSGKDERDPSKTSVKASSAAILARVLVMNTNYLAQLMTEPSLTVLLQKEGIQTEENILLSLVDLWLDKVDNVSSIQKKMYGLALSIILTLRLPQVLDKLDQILSVCTTVILGGTDDQTEESSDDYTSAANDVETIPSKEIRRRQIKASDPINQLSLEDSVRGNLQTCASLHGDSFNAAINSMHPAALAQLKQALKMP